jgi:hypothetical protein
LNICSRALLSTRRRAEVFGGFRLAATFFLANTFARGRAFFVDADRLLFPTALALAIVVVPPRLILVRPARSQCTVKAQQATTRLGPVEAPSALRLALSFPLSQRT